jgi:hypothetical protein
VKRVHVVLGADLTCIPFGERNLGEQSQGTALRLFPKPLFTQTDIHPGEKGTDFSKSNAMSRMIGNWPFLRSHMKKGAKIIYMKVQRGTSVNGEHPSRVSEMIN